MTLRESFDALLNAPLTDIFSAIGAFALGMTVVMVIACVALWLWID